MNEVKLWVNKSEKDLDIAKKNFKLGEYSASAFFCQQSVEKALKSILIKRKGKFPKIHDLVKLGKDVNLPQNLIDKLKELTLAYIYTRYPDIPEESDLMKKSADFLKIAKEVLKWVDENL